MSLIQPGQAFPDLELPDQNGKLWKLSSFTQQSEVLKLSPPARLPAEAEALSAKAGPRKAIGKGKNIDCIMIKIPHCVRYDTTVRS